MYCRNCGKEIKDNTTQCPYCNIVIANPPEENKANICWGVLGFCCPVIGLILYLLWKDEDYASAKMVSKGAIVGVAFFLTARVINYIL